MAEIGDLCETKGEMTMEWKIKDFSSLQQEVDTPYISPKFYFSGASWNIKLYPIGRTKKEYHGWLMLYIIRCSSGSPITLDCSLCLKDVDGDYEEISKMVRAVFQTKNKGRRFKVMLKTDLMEKKSEFLPSDILTVVCTLKSRYRNDVAKSLFSRHQELSDNLKEIFTKRIRTDCLLKVDGADIAAHRMILETRSPVFAAMFKHDTKENETGEISIVDVDKSSIKDILEYIYSGDINVHEIEKALSVYALAEKYNVNNVKEICSEFIINNLSDDCVCDVIKFTTVYQDEKMDRRAREYFKENVDDILKTDEWTTFAKENHDISMELLASAVTFLTSRRIKRK